MMMCRAAVAASLIPCVLYETVSVEPCTYITPAQLTGKCLYILEQPVYTDCDGHTQRQHSDEMNQLMSAQRL